jgi:hypothetical protein
MAEKDYKERQHHQVKPRTIPGTAGKLIIDRETGKVLGPDNRKARRKAARLKRYQGDT